MSRPQISVQKRLREQARRERKQMKAEKRANRKSSGAEEPSAGIPETLDGGVTDSPGTLDSNPT